MRQVTVPFFISHQGCPHTCVFCDQHTISGDRGILPTPEEMLDKIERWELTAAGRPLEIAFFGGTFTALSESCQMDLLAPLQELLKRGRISSIRLSTRPDCIDEHCVQYLAEMGVRTIELGVQSMDDNVLAASGRGHKAADSVAAIRCIKDQGLRVVAQLMPGLPGDSTVLSLSSLDKVISAGADFIRIYPVVVLKGTGLSKLYSAGDYVPVTLEDCVSLCKLLLHRAIQAGIPVIRIGLQADEGLNSDTIQAGCWHPALGQIVRSALYGDLLCQMVSGVPGSLPLTIRCHSKRISDVIGVAKSNLEREQLSGREINVLADSRLLEEELLVEVKQALYRPRPNHPLEGEGGVLLKGNIAEDIHYSTIEV